MNIATKNDDSKGCKSNRTATKKSAYSFLCERKIIVSSFKIRTRPTGTKMRTLQAWKPSNKVKKS